MADFKMADSSLQFSAEERAGVTELRRRVCGCVEPELDDSCFFVRFLRARDLNVNAAEDMLRNHLEWRKMLQVDTILTNYTPKEVIMQYVTFNLIGLDVEGSPILYFNLGKLDSRGILRACRKVDITKIIVQKLETAVQMMLKESEKRKKHIDKWTMILNFDDLSLSVVTHKQTLEVLGNLIVMYEANYPERLKVAYFINSSIYFTMGFAVVKHFLSERTYKKIKIFNRDGYREELLKLVDPEVLPAFLGGNRTDPDGNPLCPSVITAGGPIPERYFLRHAEDDLCERTGVERLTVTRMSKARLSVDVSEAGSHLEWEFRTRSRDIGFALLYRPNRLDARPLKVLIPRQRVDAAIFSETGTYKCEKPGVYIIEFDNSYSWIFQKEIYYKISVVQSPLKTSL